MLAAPVIFNGDEPPQDAAILAAPPEASLEVEDGRFVSAWLPDWTVDSGFAAFQENADMFTDLTTFFHTITGDNGNLTGLVDSSVRERVVNGTKEQGVPVLAAVLDQTPKGTMARVLNDPATRAAHINELLTLVDERGYDGIDIDYEHFAFLDGRDSWASTRPGWVAFIQELGDQLHARGKYLTVAVPPMFNNNADDSSGYWVYDWPAIADSVDTLRVMTYDYSLQDPGPISPMAYVQRATEYGLETLGPDKFRVGVPTYGRDWIVTADGACGGAGLNYNVSRSAELMEQKLQETGAAYQFNEEWQEAGFTYNQTLPGCTAVHQVNYSDARSVGAKAQYALDNGTGIALWSLGGESPDTWQTLREIRDGMAEQEQPQEQSQDQ